MIHLWERNKWRLLPFEDASRFFHRFKNNERLAGARGGGMCARCGVRAALPDSPRCGTCSTYGRDYMRGQADARADEGLCIKCGVNERDGERRHCRPCLDAANERRRQRREGDKDKGVCTRCGKPRDVPNRLQCKACIANNRVYKRTYEAKRARIKADG